MLLLDLNIDVIRSVTFNIFDFKDLVKLLSTCKLIKYCFDESFFKDYAYKLYSKQFWDKAYARPIQSSKPLLSMYYELVRIEKYQYQQEKYFTRWTINDFYRFWSFYDKRESVSIS